jgi:hypothetical protein
MTFQGFLGSRVPELENEGFELRPYRNVNAGAGMAQGV